MEDDHGISDVFKPTQAIAMIMAAFASIALYNVVELTYVIFATFKRRSGLYFWSFIVASWSIAPYTLGFMFKFFDVIDERLVSITMIAVGWCGMITGQSVVLYSRLHLVVQDFRILRWVLAMIITDAIICHIPILVLLYGSNSGNPGPYIPVYSIYEKIQITIFFLQEVIISGLYIWSTWVALKPGGNILRGDLRRAMKHLLAINVLILFLDLTVLGTEYAGFYEIQTLYKGALYSAKLKLEFRILNELVSLTKTKSPRHWSRDDTTRERQSTGHDLNTFSDHSSKGTDRTATMIEQVVETRMDQTVDHRDFKDGMKIETTIHVSRSGIYTRFDSDSDQPERTERGSLEMNPEAMESRSRLESSASSQIRFAK